MAANLRSNARWLASHCEMPQAKWSLLVLRPLAMAERRLRGLTDDEDLLPALPLANPPEPIQPCESIPVQRHKIEHDAKKRLRKTIR
eukprot:6478963-Amphidinium_carterae.1